VRGEIPKVTNAGEDSPTICWARGATLGLDLGIALNCGAFGPTFGPTNAFRDVPGLPDLFETLIDATDLTRENGKLWEEVTRLEMAETHF
jgi:hypothetical protein